MRASPLSDPHRVLATLKAYHLVYDLPYRCDLAVKSKEEVQSLIRALESCATDREHKAR